MSKALNQTGGLPMFESMPPPDKRFDGSDYDDTLDRGRLRGQILRVWKAISSRRWMSLGELEGATGDPQASISAQLRHLRKPRFGRHEIDKRRRHGDASGTWEYRLADSRNLGEGGSG